MKDRRTAREQALSGLRIGGSMVLAFAFFLMLTVATMLFVGRGDYSDLKSHWIPGGIALAVLSIVLFFTTRYWTKWIVGIVSYVLAKSLFGAPIFLLFGNLNLAKQLAFAVMYSAIAALLTWRHLKRDPAGVERVGLVAFVMAAPFALALQSVLPFVVGLTCLCAGELTERLRHIPKRKRRLGPTYQGNPLSHPGEK